jgi:hypothetical protein
LARRRIFGGQYKPAYLGRYIYIIKKNKNKIKNKKFLRRTIVVGVFLAVPRIMEIMGLAFIRCFELKLLFVQMPSVAAYHVFF